MKKTQRLLLAAIALCVITLGMLALMSTEASAVDNPCDPVYGMIKWCKSQHGHWDYTCCCCKLH